MLETATGIMSLLLQQAEAHLYSLLAVCTPRLCTDRSGHQAVSQQPRIDSSPERTEPLNKDCWLWLLLKCFHKPYSPSRKASKLLQPMQIPAALQDREP